MGREMFKGTEGKVSCGMKRLVYVGVLMVMGAAAAAWGQGSAAANGAETKVEGVLLPGAAYDVATIKPHNPSEMSSARLLPSGEFISRGMALKTIVGTAYGKFSFQILAGPAWFESDRYDVDAKPDNALGEQLQKLSWEQREKVQGRMLQALLADRVKLKVHQETKELPLFALVVEKGGLKLHESKAGEPYRMMVGNGRIVAQGISMDDLAAQLTGTIDHVVTNKTGLTGAYDFTVRYTDELSAADSSAPSIYTALQDQLGLKLESSKGPVQVLVIDHVERPSEN
jgi:uncharacterized protein (TIGR03435 family)